MVYNVNQDEGMIQQSSKTTVHELRKHQEVLLDAISFRDLPRNEMFEMKNGSSVVAHDLRYAKYFKQVCLDHQHLLDELAREEDNFFLVRK